jgi:DNA-binding IclR family transcriptional regulator
MPAGSAPSNKAKIARRVVEVLEYFDDTHREATVMDIVRRYNRPQSSTSELLSSLVELGLLFKDPNTRSYSLAPRAALLGAAGQRGLVRDGRLIGLIDRLSAQTGLSIAVFGRVGLKSQIVSWHAGPRASVQAVRGIYGGLQEPMAYGAPGWLLLSTISQPRRDGVLRRLNAEAPEDRKFSVPELTARLDACRETRRVRGTLGFGSHADVVASLLPNGHEAQPLAIGIVYGDEDRVNRDSLVRCLDEAIAGLECDARVEQLPTAA